MPKPACVKCGKFMKPHRIGVYVVEGMPVDRPGNKWQPYKVWVADLFKCRVCGREVLHGWGQTPMSERHMPDFKKWLELASFTINDC